MMFAFCDELRRVDAIIGRSVVQPANFNRNAPVVSICSFAGPFAAFRKGRSERSLKWAGEGIAKVAAMRWRCGWPRKIRGQNHRQAKNARAGFPWSIEAPPLPNLASAPLKKLAFLPPTMEEVAMSVRKTSLLAVSALVLSMSGTAAAENFDSLWSDLSFGREAAVTSSPDPADSGLLELPPPAPTLGEPKPVVLRSLRPEMIEDDTPTFDMQKAMTVSRPLACAVDQLTGAGGCDGGCDVAACDAPVCAPAKKPCLDTTCGCGDILPAGSAGGSGLCGCLHKQPKVEEWQCMPRRPVNLPNSSFLQHFSSDPCNVGVWDGYRRKCCGLYEDPNGPKPSSCHCECGEILDPIVRSAPCDTCGH